MTVIEASCPICGHVDLNPRDVVLVVFKPILTERSSYSFTCATCHEVVRKPAPADVVALLVAGGVVVTWNLVPVELVDADRTGRPITWDDVLDFARDVEDVEALDREVWG